MQSDVFNGTVRGTGSGKPYFREPAHVDFGTVKPSQWLSKPIIINNEGGAFSGNITATLTKGDDLFGVQFSSDDDQLPSQIRLVVEFNTYINEMGLLGRHSEVLEIQVGDQRLTVYVDGVIIPHTA